MKYHKFMLAPAAAGAALIMCAETARADFSGPYAPANWTFNANGGSGSQTNNGTTLVLTGNNTAMANINTDYTIAAAGTGLFSFSWSYASGDTGTYDTGGYLINSTYTQLASNAAQGSGTVSVAVTAGQIIGFRVFSADGLFGAGTLTITNFSGPLVPAPGAMALLGMAGLVGGRRRRLNN